MRITLFNSELIVTSNLDTEIKNILKNYSENKIFILVDGNTNKFCFPKIKNFLPDSTQIYTINVGEDYKSINTAVKIWEFLSNNKADRSSLLINLGGGMVTDIGGFVASTFKRGIDFINIPTTLLAQVDASIGGKVGVNLLNRKNEVGLYQSPKKTIINTDFLKTLPENELVSGYAEVVKHALLTDEKNWQKIKNFNLHKINFDALNKIVKDSILTKVNYVSKDPYEKGIREALNFGHTFGHAIEGYFKSIGKKILHGEAVAIGILCEIFLSNKICNLELEKMFHIVEYISINFKSFTINPTEYDEIYKYMKHDKKNKQDKIIFSLLSELGKVALNQTCKKNNIIQALNFYFQLKK